MGYSVPINYSLTRRSTTRWCFFDWAVLC